MNESRWGPLLRVFTDKFNVSKADVLYTQPIVKVAFFKYRKTYEQKIKLEIKVSRFKVIK